MMRQVALAWTLAFAAPWAACSSPPKPTPKEPAPATTREARKAPAEKPVVAPPPDYGRKVVEDGSSPTAGDTQARGAPVSTCGAADEPAGDGGGDAAQPGGTCTHSATFSE